MKRTNMDNFKLSLFKTSWNFIAWCRRSVKFKGNFIKSFLSTEVTAWKWGKLFAQSKHAVCEFYWAVHYLLWVGFKVCQYPTSHQFNETFCKIYMPTELNITRNSVIMDNETGNDFIFIRIKFFLFFVFFAHKWISCWIMKKNISIHLV